MARGRGCYRGELLGEMRAKFARNPTLLLPFALGKFGNIYFFWLKKRHFCLFFAPHSRKEKNTCKQDYSGKENKGALRAIVQLKLNNPPFVEYALLQPAVEQSHASHFSILHMTVPSMSVQTTPSSCSSLPFVPFLFYMQPFIQH